ncbi:MAG: methylmalonyl-CoA mutase [Chloroflexi bacterium]|nr:methylmalonyl-CoA mutase [Chloroflexota bacterium]
MFRREKLDEIEKRKKAWEETTLKRSLERFGLEKSPTSFCSPLDIKEHDFLGRVGFPGEYPFTADVYPTPGPDTGPDFLSGGTGLVRASNYTGFGTPEDTRDFYQYMKSLGRQGLAPGVGPNLAFDLPTQCGYDSDDPIARGEVGKTGVAVDTLRDFEVIYEAFTGNSELDRIASNWTINAPCNVILSMYMALAEKRGVPIEKLRGTPQNDILKEFAARGTYIFPPRPSIRMVRDSITFCTRHLPNMNTISISGYHMREAGATGEQVLAFTFSDAMAYVQLGMDAGLDVDAFVPRFTFLTFSGSMEILKEIALQRAARRMWAKIMRERFRAKNPRSWIMRAAQRATVGEYSKTRHRPLNNLTRAVLEGVASALSGGTGYTGYPYDEPLGLGHSLEGWQLNIDAARIIRYEARLCDVVDPLAGSYYIEALTDEIENKAWEIIDKIDAMGGAVAAIESGYIQREIARSAYQHQREVEKGERVIVGVNRFVGENELDVTTTRLVPHPYDPVKRDMAEERQLANLKLVKVRRNGKAVLKTLKELREAARKEDVNLIPYIFEAVKEYATIGEICNELRGVFGEYEPFAL